jgi:hypothetical protein
LVCASVLRFLPPAAPPASPVARALAPARGMLGRVLYAAAFFLLLIYTMDSQPTDKVEGVGDDFVRGGQDKTPIKQKRNSFQRTVVTADTPGICPSVHLPNRSSPGATVSRRWPWRTTTSTWPKQTLPHPPTTSVSCTAPEVTKSGGCGRCFRSGWSGQNTHQTKTQ